MHSLGPTHVGLLIITIATKITDLKREMGKQTTRVNRIETGGEKKVNTKQLRSPKPLKLKTGAKL